jgi:hypothetical protein
MNQSLTITDQPGFNFTTNLFCQKYVFAKKLPTKFTLFV